MARITALVMRIVWASRPTNVNIAIAANVFTAAGVLILFIVNLVFAQRIIRAYHPHFGWHKLANLVFRFLLFSVIALLVIVITGTVQSFFTLDPNTRRIDRDLQLFAGVYLAVIAFIPIPAVLLAALFPRKTRVEKFGSGRFRTKTRLVVFTSFLLALGAGFRIGVNFAPRPLNDPAWYHSKACYYCFNYVIELIVVYLYTVLRFDRRFHVPNGASGPGDYAGGLRKQTSLTERVNSEQDVFGPAAADGNDSLNRPIASRREEEREWEERARKELGGSASDTV
jgi:hypothetical protein